jgi:hypothetical protein
MTFKYDTYDAAIQAVKRCGIYIADVHPNLLTPELCLAAVQNNGGLAIMYMPTSKRTYEVCLAAVKQHGSALKSVPDALKTREMCDAAYKTNSMAIKYIPEHMFTPEMRAFHNQLTGWNY